MQLILPVTFLVILTNNMQGIKYEGRNHCLNHIKPQRPERCETN